MTPPSPPATGKPTPRTRTGIRLLVATASLVALAGACVITTINAQAAPPTPAGWTQNFLDDFSGNGRIGGDWRYDVGRGYPGGPPNGFGTDEIETMTDSLANVNQSGGQLHITAINNGGNWTSGRVETNRADFQPPAGGKLRVEASLKLPQVANMNGYWPAFWMLGGPYRNDLFSWPGIGEFDIMENVQGLDRVWATLHCGIENGGPCNEKSGISNGGNVGCASSPANRTTCQAGFHTYTMDWSRADQSATWYLDGRPIHRVQRGVSVDAAAWDRATGHGFFILLNLAMGGQFPACCGFGGGGAAGATSGGHMDVDYVAVYTGGADAPPPGTPGQPSQPPTPPVQTCGPLVSVGKPATATSIEAGNLAPNFAVDGNPTTRWSSQFNDPQSITVDLGSVQPVTRVRLNWEAAYATAYSIQASTNGSTWTDVLSTFIGDGGIDDIGMATVNARYVRMSGTSRATPYGYSLFEFEVYGGCGSSSPPASQPPSSNPPASQPPASQPPASGTWQVGVFYPTGAIVTYNGARYQCRQGHTAQVTWEPPNVLALWLPI